MLKKFLIAVFCLPVFAAEPEMLGLNREYWINQERERSVADLMTSKTAPAGKGYLARPIAVSWNDPNTERNVADRYAQRIWGWIVPERTGDYVFYLAGDDSAILFLSSDASPEKKKDIAVSRYCSWGDFMRHPQQQSTKIRLEKGKRYYLEAHHIERWGNDHLMIGWKEPGSKRIGIIPEENLRAR